MNRCPKCNAMVPQIARFCNVCGSAQTPAKAREEMGAPTERLRPAKSKVNRCRDCETELPVKAIFCNVCGSAQTPGDSPMEGAAPTERLRPARSKTSHCRSCKEALPRRARFCNVCGSAQIAQAARAVVLLAEMPGGMPSKANGVDRTSAAVPRPTTPKVVSSRKPAFLAIRSTAVSPSPVIPARPTGMMSESSAGRPRSKAVHPHIAPKPAASALPLDSSDSGSVLVAPSPRTQPAESSSAKVEAISDVRTLPLRERSAPVGKSPARSFIPSGRSSTLETRQTERLFTPADEMLIETPTKKMPSPAGPQSPQRSRAPYTQPAVRAQDRVAVPEPAKHRVSAPQWVLGAVTLLLPFGVLFLWSISLRNVDVRQMNDLGLVSVFPPSLIIALILLNVSFCLAIGQARVRVAVAFLHLALLIFMLYSVTTFVEEAVRFSTVYKHAGYTEYIMRTGSVDTSLDAYFSWPGFFLLSAFVTQAAGYHSILQYAAWAPVFLNFLYFGPLYMIFATITSDKRQVWVALWFFYLTNWVAQDYFSPQGLNFFFYLTIIAVLLKWFQVPPLAPLPFWTRWVRLPGRLAASSQKLYEWVIAPVQIQAPIRLWQRRALLVFLVGIFGFVVFSHPLTPFFVLASVTALIFLRRCNPLWLPVLMGLMTGAWILFMAQSFLVGHSSMVVGAVGQVQSSITANVGGRVSQGNPQHIFVAEMRVVTAMVIWGLAAFGAIRRQLRGHRELTYLLLAVAPFPLVALQDYGGEMFLRIYLFVLPIMVFFIATLFFPTHGEAVQRTPYWVTGARVAMCILLLAGFLITRFGNEHVDYKTYAEVDGISYLYHVAPPHSILLQGWEDTPWEFQDFEKYNYDSLNTAVPASVVTGNVDAIIQFSRSQQHSTYIVFTRSQIVSSESFSGLPPGTLDRLENRLVTSGYFKLIYANPDVKILIFEDAAKGS